MELFRDQANIIIILFNSSNFVSGISLADYNRTGLKTLKKDIDMLNDICLQNGCEIISKIGIGYMIDVLDQNLFDAFKNYVEKKYYSFHLYRNAQSERVHFFLRQLLTSNGVYIQDFVEQSNYSESTIRRDLVEVKKRLKRYDLSLVNKTNKGMFIVGDEWQKRLALISEHFYYVNFEKAFFTEKEAIEDVFMANNEFREVIFSKLKKVLSDNNYYVSYNRLVELVDMIIVSLQRNKYHNQLKDDYNFDSLDLVEEKDLIQLLFTSIDNCYVEPLTDTTLDYLAAYLKGCRVLRFNEFEKMAISDEVKGIVNGFFEYANQFFDIKKYDTRVLFKDLCVEITQMMIRISFGIHVQPSTVSQFIRDGMMSLDYCSLLYRYLKENTDINCNPNDVAKMYYCFSFFTKERNEKNTIKIMVVFKEGYFVSRSTAYQFAKLIGKNNIEFIPISYMRIKDSDLSDIVGFITDIGVLENELAEYPVINGHFIRKRSEIEEAVDKIIYSSKIIKDNLISPDCIHYVHSFKNMKALENYIRDNILIETDDKDLFFKEFYKRESVYSSRRNNIVLINTIGDFLNRSFIEFISLEESMEYDGDFINKVIVFNVKGRDTYYIGLVVRRIANLLHSHDFHFTGNRDEDYELIDHLLFNSES